MVRAGRSVRCGRVAARRRELISSARFIDVMTVTFEQYDVLMSIALTDEVTSCDSCCTK